MSDTTDVIIVGAGVAGLSAAREAARRGLRVCLFEELLFGGLVVNVNHLEPGLPAFPASGADLAADLMTQVTDLGIVTVYEPVTEIDAGACSVRTANASCSAAAVIVATGARPRTLGIPGEAEFEYRGVSHCADCDGPIFHKQDVMVVGGGDSALQEALVLAQFCRSVHLVHRGASFTARDEFVRQVEKLRNIRVHMESTAEALLGDEALARVVVRTRKGLHEIACTGFFAYVGLAANSSLLAGQLNLDPEGRVLVDGQLESSRRHVFAVGAVRAGYQGQLTHTLADAAVAVSAIVQRLRGHGNP